MGKAISGYTSDSIQGRDLKKAAAAGKDVKVLENVTLFGNVHFESCDIRMHEDGKLKGRKYVHLGDGKLTCVTVKSSEGAKGGDLPYNVVKISFTEENAPSVEFDWELSNKELASLTLKGIYGTDHDVNIDGAQVPKGELEIPEIFTEAEFEEIPLACNVRMLADKNGTPIASVEVKDKYYVQVNSEKTGYLDFVNFFEPVAMYPVDHKSKDAMFLSLDDSQLIGAPEMKLEPAEDAHVIRAEKVLTPEEAAEAAIISELKNEVSERTAAVLNESQVDDSVRIAEDVEVRVDADAESTAEVETENPDAEAFDEDMLADMHLIDKRTEVEREDDEKAAEKLARALHENKQKNDAISQQTASEQQQFN